MRKRNFRTSLLILSRNVGLICRKPKYIKPTIKIQSTYYPDASTTPIESARFIFLQNKLSSRLKGCSFDPKTETCECGADVDQFLDSCKKLTKE